MAATIWPTPEGKRLFATAERRWGPSAEAAAEPAELESVEPALLGAEAVDSAEVEAEPECSHPAEARDYQSGTCAACGAILWD